MLCLMFLFQGGSGAGSTRPDVVHTHLTRIIGCQFFYTAVISLYAPGFLHEHDKQKLFLNRILVSTLM